MHLVDYKMTGKEFQELYKRAKRTYKSVQKFADHLNIGRTSIYEAFMMEHIPHDIDEAIDKDPELVKLKNKIMRGDQPPEVMEDESTEVYAGPSDKMFERAFTAIMISIENTASSIAQNSALLETVKDDNKFIKDDAMEFRAMAQNYRSMLENILQTNNLVLEPKKR